MKCTSNVRFLSNIWGVFLMSKYFHEFMITYKKIKKQNNNMRNTDENER